MLKKTSQSIKSYALQVFKFIDVKVIVCSSYQVIATPWTFHVNCKLCIICITSVATPHKSKRSFRTPGEEGGTAADAANERLSIYWDLCVFRDHSTDAAMPTSPPRGSQKLSESTSETPVRRRDRLRQEVHRIKCALLRCKTEDYDEVLYFVVDMI